MNNYKPNVAPGSTYSIEVKINPKRPAYIILSQDNGQHIVLHSDDLDELIKTIREELNKNE